MGTQIIDNGSPVAWNQKLVAPVNRGLEGWFQFDTDAARFGFNRALNKSNAAMIGLPVAYATHGRFKGLSNYLQTPIGETEEMTFLVVGKAAAAIPAGASGAGDANTPFYVGNYRGMSKTSGYAGAVLGTNLFHVGAATVTGQGARSDGAGGVSNGNVSLTGEAPVNWAIRGIRVSNGETKVFNLTSGTSLVIANTASRILADTNIRIGSGTQNFGAEVDISAVVIASVAWTDSEIQAVATKMRNRMLRLGIVV